MIELGLQRISRLLQGTSFPWRAIHVAGTNGKGSICAYISGMLDAYNRSEWRQENGHSLLKHGRFTSPHLIDRWDCITLNQKPVVASAFQEREKAVIERNRLEGIHASEFELMTATAFELFTREELDVGVVEVGMGGRLDATNVIGQADDGTSLPDDVPTSSYRSPPLVTAISSIGLDHQAFLGDTLEDIAREKAGIIKPRVPVVYAPNPSGVVGALSNVALALRSPMYAAVEEGAVTSAPRSLSALMDYLEQHHSPSALPKHARINARTAYLATWIALQRLGRLPIDGADVLKPTIGSPIPPAIEMFQVPWQIVSPGRLQQLSLRSLTGRRESVLLDGAHNAQSAEALGSEIQRLGYRSNGRRITWVLAASDTKDAKELLAPLLHVGDTVFTVAFGPVDGMPWVKAQESNTLAAAAREVVANAGSLGIHDYGHDVLTALKMASQTAGSGPLVVAGSLYLVGDVLRLVGMREEKEVQQDVS